jgi:hypothetical protein
MPAHRGARPPGVPGSECTRRSSAALSLKLALVHSRPATRLVPGSLRGFGQPSAPGVYTGSGSGSFGSGAGSGNGSTGGSGLGNTDRAVTAGGACSDNVTSHSQQSLHRPHLSQT